ncbi:MAG TPA: L,D-transpeptidase [Acidimicrobiales bacterium]|jgi:hypothetical protein|nr:L,D-transpeptidase [Acidimicrobiales bacterium]
MGIHSKPKDPMGWVARVGLISAGVLILLGVAVALLLSFGRPQISVSESDQSLFAVHVSGMGSRLSSLTVTSGGHPVTLRQKAGGYIPASPMGQGQTVKVSARATSPSWLHWLVGSGTSTAKTINTPSAAPAVKVAISSSPGQVRVSFTHPVTVVSYRVAGSDTPKTVTLPSASTFADLAVPQAAAGSVEVVDAPQSWESLSTTPSSVTWFVIPADGETVALVSPAPGSAAANANQPITLTFDGPVSQALGGQHPTLTPDVPGTWSQPNEDSLVFTPSGFGFGPGATVKVTFAKAVKAVGYSATTTTDSASATSAYTYSTAPASLLRMEQILTQLHYLPFTFTPSAGASLPTDMAGQVSDMTQPPAGTFQWRWANAPATLQAKWTTPGTDNELVKGALMAFLNVDPSYHYDGYKAEESTVAELATPQVWQQLLQASMANSVDPDPYTYVYVTKHAPETLTLWQDGVVKMTSAANTGIPQAPTADGTFPVYIRFAQAHMKGTNPDGTKYDDLVSWISYFNGGDAVHAFPRGAYGYPQSLGCVELPGSSGESAYNLMAIGNLVTVAG